MMNLSASVKLRHVVARFDVFVFSSEDGHSVLALSSRLVMMRLEKRESGF
jgi:hypothetical protein